MEFKTERLLVRPWKETDAHDLYELAKDVRVGPITGWPVHHSEEESLDVIRNVFHEGEDYAVIRREGGVLIGDIGVMPKPRMEEAKPGEVELGFWLGFPYWGQGFMPEVVRFFERYLFTETDCGGIWCGYFDGNEKSKRCQEKCGFSYVRTVENVVCSLLGETRTEHYMYLSREDWLKNHQA